jgi:hypothetical protein
MRRDAPNAWPPLVLFAVEALQRSGVEGAAELAEELADRWLAANAAAWAATGAMHEKLDGRRCGGVGGGGEYAPQTGFGAAGGRPGRAVGQGRGRMGWRGFVSVGQRYGTSATAAAAAAGRRRGPPLPDGAA